MSPSPKKDVWPLATAAGVTDCVADAGDWAGQDFDLVVDYAGFDTTQKGINALKRFGGKVVQVGLGQPSLTIATVSILGKCIVGSLGGTVQDIEEVFTLMLSGEIRPAYTEIGFDDIGAGLEKLANNQVTGRLVARFGD